jgi:hypothetical protein
MLYTNLYRNTNIYFLIFFFVGGVVGGISLFTAGTKRATVVLFIPFLEEVHHSVE